MTLCSTNDVKLLFAMPATADVTSHRPAKLVAAAKQPPKLDREVERLERRSVSYQLICYGLQHCLVRLHPICKPAS